jgi:hypothetical protein
VKFNYPNRSRFIEQLREGIKRQKPRLEDGRAIEITLGPRGYDGKGVVTIRVDDAKQFEVQPTTKHPDRFSQRIRAAAWALRQEECFGRFLIEHDRGAGVVTIRRDG